jgi:hypothetical protein
VEEEEGRTKTYILCLISVTHSDLPPFIQKEKNNSIWEEGSARTHASKHKNMK